MLNLQINQLSRRLIVSSAAKIPVITMPAKLQERVEKVRARIEEKESKRRLELSMGGNKDVPIVSCKNKLFNHYKGQTFRTHDSIRLASLHWVKRQTAGDYFVLNSYARNPALADTEGEEQVRFENLGLRPELVQRLQECDFGRPTKIQELAIPTILQGNNAMCAAETGSGKTLAYLLPILSNILDLKEATNREDTYLAPLAVIVVPGRELACQIKSVIDTVTEPLSINCTSLIGGLGTKRLMCNPPICPVDVLVASLGVVKKMVSSGIYKIGDVRHLVIDEADTLMDDSFNFDTIAFLKKFRFREGTPANPLDPNIGVQLLMVSATMPQNLGAILSNTVMYNSIHHIATPHLHRLMPHVPQKFLRMIKSDKPARLLEIAKSAANRKHRVLVFSKDSATCYFVAKFLEDNGVQVLRMDGNMLGKTRAGQFEKFQEGQSFVFSTTDLGSRGLDTVKVQHVINYDFPRNMSDYIHRAGRVGRVGSQVTGHVTNFISSASEVDLVQKIEMAARMTVILPEVNANIKRQIMKDMGEEEIIYD